MKDEQPPKPDVLGKQPPRSVQSESLFKGQREVAIVYGNETYLLSITRNDKLILTK